MKLTEIPIETSAFIPKGTVWFLPRAMFEEGIRPGETVETWAQRVLKDKRVGVIVGLGEGKPRG